MRYNYLAIGDIHFGAMDINKTCDNLQFVLDFIIEMKDRIDMLVICGDYFDHRIQLSSKTAILSIQWFDELVATCKNSNVKAIRIIKGTKEHDNDQLEVLRSAYETSDNYIKIFNNTVVEETIPGLKCYYGPDEVISTEEYMKTYIDELMSFSDIGFFHGNFDVVLPDIAIDKIRNNNLPVMIYERDTMGKFIKGPLIASHWHLPVSENPLFYIGSYDRWMFGEEDPKGFIYGNYDTDDNSYQINRVINPYATNYISINYVDTEYSKPENFSEMCNDIDDCLSLDDMCRLRINFIITQEDDNIMDNLNMVQKRYGVNNRVKFNISNVLKKTIKKRKTEEVYLNTSKYNYIFNNPNNIAENISKFIEDKNGVIISVNDIKAHIDKYLS